MWGQTLPPGKRSLMVCDYERLEVVVAIAVILVSHISSTCLARDGTEMLRSAAYVTKRE